MSLSQDDDIGLAAFAPEDRLRIHDIQEDDDPMRAFGAEEDAGMPESARDVRTAEPTPRLTLASPGVRNGSIQLWGALVAGALAIAAGIYLSPLKFIPRVAQTATTDIPRVEPVAADEDVETPAAGANGDGIAATTPQREEHLDSDKPADIVVRAVPTDTAPKTPAPAPPSEVAASVTGADNRLEDSSPLSGEWVMNTRVESSQLKRYEGLRLGYLVRLRQDGNRISGTGRKVTEDEQTIGAARQTPITMAGVMNGDRVELTFTEGGTARASAGKLVLARDSEDVLRGRFSSTAARSLGVVEIHR